MNDFIDDAITAADVKMDVSAKGALLYACTLVSTHGKMSRDIAMKPDSPAPTLGNIVYHYALVAQEVSQYDDILEWAKDTGRDLNDPSTIPYFNQMVADKTDLRLLLSERVYVDMMAALEINQAIANARPR